ncbi:MAG: hypothetical protein HZC02_01000 [Candidatus Levybacteria bacterium]|nr:hypothetical protein [Candidatus Levybacteria bacterium]
MKGQTIVEVMVALGAGAIILAAMSVIILNSLKNSTQSSQQGKAVDFAQEGLEIARQMKNNDWGTFSTLSGSYCVASSCTAISTSGSTCGPKSSSCPVNIDNTYVREVTVTQNYSDCQPQTPVSGVTYSKVVSTVSWNDTSCKDSSNVYCHSARLETCLSNFGGRPAP